MRKHQYNKNYNPNNVHIAGRGSVVRQLRILVSQFHVLRTGMLSEIRPDNMYQPLPPSVKRQKTGQFATFRENIKLMTSQRTKQHICNSHKLTHKPKIAKELFLAFTQIASN